MVLFVFQLFPELGLYDLLHLHRLELLAKVRLDRIRVRIPRLVFVRHSCCFLLVTLNSTFFSLFPLPSRARSQPLLEKMSGVGSRTRFLGSILPVSSPSPLAAVRMSGPSRIMLGKRRRKIVCKFFNTRCAHALDRAGAAPSRPAR